MTMKDLSALDVPGPTITALSAPFWKAGQEGACPPALRRLRALGVLPARPLPILLGSQTDVSRRVRPRPPQVLFTVHKPGHPGWLPIAPYTVGLIELEEGPAMLSFIILEDGEGAAAGWDTYAAFADTDRQADPAMFSEGLSRKVEMS
jgi:uncharacterized protein